MQISFKQIAVIILMMICIFTLPEFIDVINGTCLFGLALWSYRLGLISWIMLGILILKDTNKKHEERKRKRRNK